MVFKLWFDDQEVLLEACSQGRNTTHTSPYTPCCGCPTPPVPTEHSLLGKGLGLGIIPPSEKRN